MTSRRMKTTGEVSVHICMIHMILYYLTENIKLQTAIIILLSMILWWMILCRKYPSLSYNYFVSFMGLMTHLVQAKYSLDIHTTAVNVIIKQKNRITSEWSCFAILIPGLARWFTWLKEIILTKGFGDAVIKFCNNGVLKIGSHITVLNPLPILNRLRNEILIIDSRYLAVIMEPSMMVHSDRADFGSVKNNTIDFFFNNVSITINFYFPELTKCSGLFCD